MPPDDTLEIRPRTTGEVLDDAWRLALADAPLLLALSGLFAVPALAALLLLAALPAPQTWATRWALPALAALLLPLTGLGSGACQEVFRRRAEGLPVTLGGCLLASLRLGVGHVAVRAVTLLVLLPALGCLGAAAWVAVRHGFDLVLVLLALPGLFLAGLGLWLTHAVHPIVASGDAGPFGALSLATSRELRRNSNKAGAAALSRVVLYVLGVANLHVLVAAVLWVAGSLAGLDTALFDLVLAVGNPVYVVAVAALAWLLLAPFAEAANFLLYLDSRVRYDGLDLWYRFRTLFPATDRGRVALLAIAGLLLLAPPARAEDNRLTVVRAVRQEVQKLIEEVKSADPYPQDGRYEPRLRRLAERLEDAGDGQPDRLRWFTRALEGFGKRDREGALEVLADLDDNLALMEEGLQPAGGEGERRRTRAEVKSQLPDTEAPAPDGSKERKPREVEDEPVRRDDPGEDGAGGRGGGGRGVVAPQVGGGFGALGWMLLAGLLLAVLLVMLVLFLQYGRPRREKESVTEGAAPPPEAAEAEPEQRSPSEWWRRAERLAVEGNFLEAVRHLYLAVLGLLHEASLIRCERTRTNGEYLRQLRAADAAEAVAEPFGRLTRLFEQKWYGERACREQDYDTCRDLASQVRDNV
jgi:hypothetical protein